MPIANGDQSLSFAGVRQYWNFSIFGQAEVLAQPSAPKASAAITWTNGAPPSGSSGSAGSSGGGSSGSVAPGNTATVLKGHGIVTSQQVDLVTPTGHVYGATAAVTSGNGTTDTIACSGGVGAYPAPGASVILCPQKAVAVAFVADAIQAIIATAQAACLVALVDSVGTAHVLSISPTQGYQWNVQMPFANPLAGLTIASATVSTSDLVGVNADPESGASNAGCIVNVGYLYGAQS